MMRPAPAPAAVKSFNCAKCGATLTVRTAGAVVVSCGSCGSIVDAQDPGHQLIRQYQARTSVQPQIPIGTRGQLRGEPFQCIGLLVRRTTVDGIGYSWREYLLWHPHRGYRWLAESNGHWSYLKPLVGRPVKNAEGCTHLGRLYRRFQSGKAEITFALGEFDWRVAVGQESKMTDFVAPPYMLCEEESGDEIHWTLGEYQDPKSIWEGFKLSGEPPLPTNVGPTQPSPYEGLARPMKHATLLSLALVTLIQIAGCFLGQNKVVLAESFTCSTADPEKSRVSKVFELTGRRSNVKVEIFANVNQNYAWFSMALINEVTGDALAFSREVERYSGVDGGEAWSEGADHDSVVLSAVPSGRWYVRLEPETGQKELSYQVKVWRDVPTFWPYAAAIALIFLPWLLYLYLRRRFEYRRWLDSDHPMRPLLNIGSDS